jgi:tetratricopeptide (TPR) repeat protein
VVIDAPELVSDSPWTGHDAAASADVVHGDDTFDLVEPSPMPDPFDTFDAIDAIDIDVSDVVASAMSNEQGGASEVSDHTADAPSVSSTVEASWDDVPALADSLALIEGLDLLSDPTSDVSTAHEFSRAEWAMDPHDLALPGELPPLELPTSLLDVDGVALDGEEATTDLGFDFSWESLDEAHDESVVDADAGHAARDDAIDSDPSAETSASVAPTLDLELDAVLDEVASATTAAAEPPDFDELDLDAAFADALDAIGAAPALVPSTNVDAPTGDAADAVLDTIFAVEGPTTEAERALASLRIMVARTPFDWSARRRLTDALFDGGDADAAVALLAETSALYEERGRLAEAAQAVDEIVRVRPDGIDAHQRRVELAVRMNDSARLTLSYLDLADALVRLGEAPKAQAVYLRVLELDPFDTRARAALGAAAPPMPTRPPEAYEELGAWLRDDAPSTRFVMSAPEPTGDEDADFQLLLQRFKEGVAEAVGDDDHESHYDLGVAYKEMGLVDDAIAEFQKALRSRQHRLRSYEALGQCFVEQRNYQVAVTVMHRALQEPGVDEEQLVGVLYLLGYATEALQRWPEAKSYYERVVATDITFRDVAARLAALDRLTR